MFYKPLLEII